MLRSLKLLSVLLGLSGCGSSTVQPSEADGWNKLEVFARCFERMAKSSIPAGSGEGERLDLANGMPRDEQTKLNRDGHFLIEIPAKPPANPSDIIFGCAGNYKQRRLEFVRLNEHEKRPLAGEIWSY